MDTSVVVQMTAQDAELVAAWQRARKGPQGMGEELDKVRRKGTDASSQIERGFKSVASSVLGFSSATGAVLKVAQLINAEWTAITDRMKEAANRQVDVTQAFRRAASASREIAPDELYQRTIRGANGVDPRELFLAYEGAVGSAGNIPAQTVLSSVLETARLRPEFDLESRSSTVRASLMLQKAFGVKPKEAVAGTLQAFSADSTESAQAFATTLAPAVSQLHALGGGKDSFEFLMSELIGFGQRAGDPRGKRTATNYINLARQYKERAIAGGHVDRNASLEDSLNAVRNDPKIQQLMLTYFAEDSLGKSTAQIRREVKRNRKDMGGEEMSVEARTFVAAMETIQKDQSGENKTALERQAARRKLKGLTPAAVADIEAGNKALEDSKYSEAANLAKGGRQSESLAQLLDTPSAIKAQANEDTFKSLKNSGMGYTKRAALYGLSQIGLAASSNDDEGAAGELRKYKNILQGTMVRDGRLNAEGKLSDSQIRNREVLETTLKSIDETLKRLEQRSGETQKVEIAGDSRPDVPQSSSKADRLSD